MNKWVFFTIQLENVCFVSRLPKYVKRDDKWRVNNKEWYAIEFNDWYGQHYMHWVYFSPEDFAKWKEITAKELVNRRNQDQKRAMMMEYGNDRLIAELKAKKVNEDKDDSGYIMTLYKIVDKDDADWVMMFYEAIDPSKNEKIVLRVPPNITTAYEAKMWTFPAMWNVYQELQSKVSFTIEE